MRLMVDAAFDTVFVGIETPEPLSLAECGKTQNRRRDLIADVKKMQRSGLQVQGGFIVGFDHETPSTFQRQITFIQQSGIVTAMVGLLQAFAGTRLYERLRSEGRLDGDGSGDNADGTTNVVPRMGLEALSEGYRTILRHIYAPGPYYQRIRTFLREYRPPKASPPLTSSHILAFIRSLYRLGIIGQERFQYWKLLAWTTLRRPRLFGEAVRLAICGHHYRRVCQTHGM
jgi:radical SAM superfamily enzyme YgiQ (UPF0313 family)